MDHLTCVFEIWNQFKEVIFSVNSLNSSLFHTLCLKKNCCYWYPQQSKIFGWVLKLDVVQGWRDCWLHRYILKNETALMSMIYILIYNEPVYGGYISRPNILKCFCSHYKLIIDVYNHFKTSGTYQDISHYICC